ncbi:MAG: hypothetical protein H7147_08285 [Frankiaceae bacterium]|nr:hypothetical protein [Arenimonas sp.]
MILRRLTQSLKEQNWTAIVIEFVLLVSGVFLGIQVSNWNEARADRAAYEAALSRLGEEIDTNLSSLDTFDVDIEGSIAKGTKALTALQSCVDSEANRRIVDEGLETIRGTSGLHPRRNELDQIASNPRLLAQQTRSERQRFSELLFFFDVLQQTADSAERRPEDNGMENNPLLRVGAPYRFSSKYFGFDWVSTRRKLELGVPVVQACRDNQLIKSFFNWERIQGSLPVISRKWRAELTATKKLIEARR